MHRTVLVGLVALGCIAAPGCTGSGDGSPDGAALQEGLWESVDAIDVSAFREAGEAPAGRPHVRYVRLEQFDEAEARAAYRERIVRVPGDSGPETLLSADSAGAFRFGSVGRFVDGGGGVPAPVDLVPYVLPDDAPWLRVRNREKYVVETLPDSTFLGVPVRRIEIRARPGAGDDEVVRRVRYLVADASGRVLAVELERVTASLLFTEHSRAFLGMQEDDAGGLLPALARYETRIRSRFGGEYRFRAVTAWYGFGR